MAKDDSVGHLMDEARSIIDRDIAQLQESIRALKSRRNELALISHLPSEILCNIFSFIEDRTMSQIQRPQCWINFSQVSQHWRSLALSAPELWTNIPCRNARWAEEMLARSKMAKLTIQVDLTYQSSNSRFFDSIKLCLFQMIRLEELNISAAPGLTLERLFQDLPNSAPQLRTLRLTSPSSGYLGPASFTIHEDLLSDTERLQCVHLEKCKISWNSRLLTGLTRLTLHDSLKHDANSSTIQFLQALQRMPALTDLDLEDSIPHDPGELSNYPVVDLPCLRMLRISSVVGAVTPALRHITFPSMAVLRITCRESQSTQVDLSNFVSVLAAKFLSSLVIRSLSLQNLDTLASQNGLRFQMWSSGVVPHLYRPGARVPSRLELVLTWPCPPAPHRLQKYAKALTAIFDAMSLSALTHLDLCTLDNIDSRTWLKTFAKLPRLERVDVKGYAVTSFFDALVHKTKAAEKSISAYRTVSFPRLRHICLNGIDFSDANGSISVIKLMDCLMERCDRNAEIQELCLDDCYNIMDEDVEELREIVVDVNWDGVEQLSDEYDSEEKDYDSDGNTIYDEPDDYGFWGSGYY